MEDTRNAPRFSATLAVVALAALVTGMARAADAPAVPADVRIPVELTSSISSQTGHVGDAFAFKTTKDEKLGGLDVPAGTPGSGRLAMVQPAHDKEHGTLALQADSLQPANGPIVWVNIDASQPPTGRLADKHTKFVILPVPIGIVPATIQVTSGNMILDPGTAFRVVTIAPRKAPAPLVTATPSAAPTSAASMSPAPSPTST